MSPLKDIKLIITFPPTKKSTGPDEWIEEFHERFKWELIPILNFGGKNEEDGTLPNSINKSSITLIPKLDTDMTRRKKFQANIPGK